MIGNHLGKIEHSVIRRSFVILSMTAPAMLLNLGLVYASSIMLASDQFGIFYLAITLTNIIFAPSVILTLFYSRFIVETSDLYGETTTFHIIGKYVKFVCFWSFVFSLVILGIALSVGYLHKITAIELIFIIILVDLLAYIAETARTSLQGLQRFTHLGLYTLAWMFFRFFLALLGLHLFGSVAAGLMGVAISALFVFPMFFFWLKKKTMHTAYPKVLPRFPSFYKISPIAIGYATFVVISNLDIVLAYFVLSEQELGVYAASTILPKGVLLITMPVMQVIFPVIVKRVQGSGLDRSLTIRAFTITIAVATVGAMSILLFDDLLCTSEFGIAHCSLSLLPLLTISSIPFCLVRLFTMFHYATHRDWLPMLLLIPALMFSVFILESSVDKEDLARYFVTFSCATCFFYTLIVAGTFKPNNT